MSSASKSRRSRFLAWNPLQQLEAAPLAEVEDSIPLRVLAQAMVIVGILATDLAAGTQLSVWAVPLSIAGAVWSWYRRRDRNIPTKFALAIAMLLALGSFFVGLAEDLNDTRLVLADLLIKLQVLHSFDLPRRKDLGYSMVIGLILLGVASTLSQTIVFGLPLLAFLAITLPVLVLDYRSRLGLISHGLRLKGGGLSAKRLGQFLVIILALGLTIFALMPRFPGYQLRTFPVTAPPGFTDQYDSRQIINPGYVREGQGSGQEGNGIGPNGAGQAQARGPGKLDEDQYYGFNTQINQNLRGAVKPRIVMRVRSQTEGFWRVLAFDRYNGQGWEISRNDQTTTINRPSWSYQFFLPRPITINKTRQIVQTYTMVSELPNLIPALVQPRELYFPTQRISVDPEGALRSPGLLQEGLTYTVISEVPYRDRSRLSQASTLYPRDIRQHYLDVPPGIANKVRQKTLELLATSPKPITSPYEKALYLAQRLKQHYRIQPDVPFLAENEDLVEAFLFRFEGGYPDHFSTTLTIMLRSIGIPARLVAGFAPGQFNPFTGLYVVHNTDAYAMTEVFFPKHGWFAFDPIPGHELIPPSIEENQTFSVLKQFWKWVAGWLPSPVTGVLTRVVTFIVAGLIGILAWLFGLLSQGWLGLFAGLILAIALGFLGWLSWKGWKQWRYRRWLAKLPPMEGLYQQMLTWLAHKGFRKHPAQTPMEYANQSRQHQPSDQAQVIEELSQAYVRWRYGGQDPNLNQLSQKLQALRRSEARRRKRKERSLTP